MQGVPHKLRGWVWWHTSGASIRKQQAPQDYFERKAEEGEQGRAIRQIELVGLLGCCTCTVANYFHMPLP